MALFASTLSACAHARNVVCVPDHIATITMMRDGAVFLNGEATPIERLSERLGSLNVLGVWLYRQPALGRSHEAERAYNGVLRAIVDNRVIHTWSTRPDFSNYVGLDTGTVYPRELACQQPVTRDGYTIYPL